MEETPVTPRQDNFAGKKRLTLLMLGIAAVLFLLLYKYPLLRTYQSWNSQHGYNSNGLVIFLGGCWLFYAARRKMREAAKGVCWWGLALLGFGLLCTLGLKRADFNAAQTVFCLFSFWSAVLYLCGWPTARQAIFPLVIMLFSVQWGLGSSIVSTHLRILSTDLACRFINLTGRPWDIQVIRQGTNVSLVNIPDVQFDVAAPCSGLQSLIMTSVLCLVMAYLSLKTWWKRAVMVLLIAPIAVLNNSLRIVLIAYCGSFFTWLEHVLHLSEGWGRNVAFGAFHEYPGVVVYTLGFIMIFVASAILERLPGVERELAAQRKREKEAAKKAAQDAPAEEVREDIEPGQASPYYGLVVRHAAAVLILVAAAYLLAGHVKENIRYTPGLAYGSIPYLVSGDNGLSVRLLPMITNIPLRTATMTGIPVPVSELELKELPEDTTYFRTFYVKNETEKGYQKIMTALFNPAASDEERYAAFRELETRRPFDPQSVTGFVASSSAWRSNLVSRAKNLKGAEDFQNYRQFAEILRVFALSQLVQTHRDPDSVMLAIVQNDKDHHSIHAPEACFPSQGWTIDEPVDFPLSLGGQEFQAARMDVSFRQAGLRETIVYWYQCDHRLHGTANPLYATRKYMWLPFKTTFDLVFKGLGDRWAFVRFSNSLLDDESYDKGGETINRLLRELEPYLMYKD